MNKIAQDRIIGLLQDGWELGLTTGINPNAWLQRNLMRGGDSFECNMKSFHGLVHRGIIKRLPKRNNDPFWLVRYSLTERAK